MRIPGTQLELRYDQRGRSVALSPLGTADRLAEQRRDAVLTLGQWWQQLQSFGFGGLSYPFGYGFSQTIPGKPQEDISNAFQSFVRQAYKENGPVFACILIRMAVFSDIRLQWRRLRDGKPQDLFGTPELRRLESPWPGGKAGDLLARMEQDASLAGNSFTLRKPEGVARLRPDWCSIIAETPRQLEDPRDILQDPYAEVVAYAFTPGGPASGKEPQVFAADLMAHYAPIPDPESRFRGMSWLQPIVLDIMGDKAASQHKLSVFERGGTPNMVVAFDKEAVPDLDSYNKWVDAIEEQIASFRPGNRTLYLGGGADTTVVGATFEQQTFKEVTGAGETRIASAAGVPPILAGFSEGLEGAKYDNYLQARRRFADGTMRWLWRCACSSLERIMTVPGGAELWYDITDCAFLQEDLKAAAEVQKSEAETIRRLTDGGYKPETVVAAVVNTDWTMLEYDPTVKPVQVSPSGGNGSGDAEAVPVPTNPDGSPADQEED